MIWHQMFKLKAIAAKKSLTHLLFRYSNLYLCFNFNTKKLPLSSMHPYSLVITSIP